MLSMKDPHKLMDFTYQSNRPIDPVFHSHSFYEVFYFHEGKCNYLIGDKIYVLSPGDLILMYGMTLHCAKIDRSFPYVRSLIHFEPAIVHPHLEQPQAINILQPFQELKNHRISLSGRDRAEAERILLFMHEQNQRQDQIGTNRMQLAFIDLLYFIYEQCLLPLKNKPEFSSEKEKNVQDMISFLESNYMEDLHLEQLQDHLHLSKYYLSKIFKEVTGVTIFEFIYQRRINQAKIYFLLNPKLSVTEVCFQVGFKHLAHFSRLFKQQVGATPETYKKQLKQP
jgi:AraC-like DNA-binding protein